MRQENHGTSLWSVTAISVIGFSSPIDFQAHRKRPYPFGGRFFHARFMRYGGCAWGAFGRAGFLESRSANPRTVATHLV
ncbi:hypothetical protein GC387_11455 [Pseudomonas sp. MWU12-2323]|nr:hypothetical protein [Pseudomonas sp. MWU12-2323]